MPGIVAWVREHQWAGDAALAVLIAVPVGASTLSLLTDVPGGTVAWLVSVSAVLHLTVVTRRVRPRASFAVAALAEFALLVSPAVAIPTDDGTASFPPVLLPSSLAFAFALYAVSAYGRPPAPSAALAVGLVGAVATSVRTAVSSYGVLHGSWTQAFAAVSLVVTVVAAWTLGAFRRLHDGQAERERRAQADAAVRAERARVARELHDVVSHSLAVVVRQADAGRYVARSDPDAAARVLATVADTGRSALADMRALLGVLRTDENAAAPTPTTADIAALVERTRAAGQDVDLARHGTPRRLPAAAELAAYRLVQEGLTNVVKHAGDGARTEVVLTWDAGGLSVCVRDDGGGGTRRALGHHDGGGHDGGGHDGGGHGLAGLRERVALIGGTFDAGPDAAGFALHARVPAVGP